MLDNLKGELRIFTKEVEGNDKKKKVLFNACIGSTKNEDKTYTNYYVSVNFSAEVKKEVASVYKEKSFDIVLKEGWLKAYVSSDGEVKPVLFVNKAKVITEGQKSTDEDLPF